MEQAGRHSEHERAASIAVGTGPDGALTYLVDLAPEALPAVRGRDLAAAWDAARESALARMRGAARGFWFRRHDGSCMHLELADPDARCWAGAVDTTVGIHTRYGLSLCLRLLALVDLLARAGWASGVLRFAPDGAELHPALLRAAASVPLTAEARFDEAGFRAFLGRRLALAPA